MKNTVTFFKPFDFKEQQKIRITEGPRKGDWLVVSVSERKVSLRCPISGKQFDWDRFCYLTEEQENIDWPEKD